MQPLRSSTGRGGTRSGNASVDVLTRRHRPDYKIVLYMGLLMLIGLVVMYAIGPQRANVLNSLTGSDLKESYFFTKQATSLAIALVAFSFMALVPFKLLQKYSSKIFMLSIGGCILLALAGFAGWGIAQESLGATRWLNFGSLSFQPAEFLKFGVLVFVASFLGIRMKQGQVNDIHRTLIPLGVVTALTMFFVIVLQKDMGTGIALVAILTTMLFVAGINKKIGLTLIVCLLLSGVLLIVSAPHRLERVATYFSGDSATVDDAGGYHVTHAKIAIGSGGLLGAGIGNSIQATGYLPEAINDSVFAIMGETFGFVGLVVIILLFTALLMRLLKVMDHLADQRMKLLAAGVFGWMASHVILNIAAMIGLVPLTGITLPLLSYGGTSMLFIAAALGAVFQVSHYTIHASKLKESNYESSSSWRRVGGSRDSSSRGTSRA